MSEEKKDKKEEKEIKKLQKKCEEYLDGWKRAKADYSNLKKESEKKSIELAQFANASLVLQVLPVYDNMKLAVKHIPEKEKEKDWVKGVIQIKKQFREFLKNLNIEEIKTVNEKFDPELHEAVAHEEKKDFEKDIIFEEVSSGYKMYGKTLSAAKVKVAK